jgi:hypothetical protein
MPHMFGATITETVDGLYHSPINIQRELTLVSLLFAIALLGAVYFKRANFFVLSIWVVVTLFSASWRYRQFKRYGSIGRPSVSLANRALYIDRPSYSDGGVTIPLCELERVIIYGQNRRRIFRLMRRDKSFLEVPPQWSASLEQRAIQFLAHALPEKVTIEPPQSIFASVRGDGPYTDA